MSTVDKITFGNDVYDMDDIITVYETTDNSNPPIPMIAVASKSRGLVLYPMTLENRLSFVEWTGMQLKIQILKEDVSKRTTLNKNKP